MTTHTIVVCERCGFIALLPETIGWQMHTTQKALCPACVKDSENTPPARAPSRHGQRVEPR
jgi:hypothetical protein